jgi:hypothetical protein
MVSRSMGVAAYLVVDATYVSISHNNAFGSVIARCVIMIASGGVTDPLEIDPTESPPDS